MPLGQAKQSNIRKFKALYHRNGSSEGFYHCEFLHRSGNHFIALHAIVFDNQLAVFSTEAPLNRYDGWYFDYAIREALKLQEEHQPAYAHKHA